jgi:methylase of polypeptide subunit release factors
MGRIAGMARHPVPERQAATTLGNALRKVGYTEAAVYRLLGDDAYSLDREDAPVGNRRLPQTRLATVVRLCLLELPVSTRDAIRALGASGVDALEATGMAEVEGDVVPRGRIIPVGELLVASDDYPSEDADDPPDYVAAYTPTSQLCASLTPRRQIARALDVGTGSGVQALLAARHTRHVVATDVNPRALAYTELNAALNGITNVDCRRGSLFEPVDGESFDLITSNAPYVVSPENRYAYRDAGLEADEISERVVQEAAEHLTEGGFGTLLVSWLASDPDEPDERVLSWTDPLDCDTWILPVWGSDPLDHAAIWNEHLADDGDRFTKALDEWTSYLARIGGRWVTEGAVILHRRVGASHTTRIDEIDEEVLSGAGEQVQRAFAARARLAELGRMDDLLDARLSVAMPLRFERELNPRKRDGRRAWIELGEGTHHRVDVPLQILEIISSLDGKARLGDIVRNTADRRRALTAVRELVELGALQFH